MAPKRDSFPLNLRPQSLQPIEFKTVVYHLDVDPGVTPENLLDPRFWALCAGAKMRPGQIVHCVWEDQTWYVQLLVLAASQAGARVAILQSVDLTKASTSPAMMNAGEAYEVEWKGPAVKYRVVRTSDQVEIARGLGKAAAYKLVEERAMVDAR